MEPVRFTVPGPPIGKERARKGRSGPAPLANSHWYTPEKTALYQKAVAQSFFVANLGRKMDPQAVHVEVNCFFKSKAHPDPDNVLKLVLDALTGLAYRNDRHVSSQVSHQYDKKRPRIEVVVS